MSISPVPVEFMHVTTAIAVGISPSMVSSAALLGLRKARYTCKPALTTISTVTAISKINEITFTREGCEWDSGLESVRWPKDC